MPSPTDNLFGKIAITRGLVTPKELLECLAAKDSLRRQGKNMMLGQIMFERGYLTKEQVVEILDTQKKAILVCGSCGTKYNVEGFQPGRKVKCRVCRTVLRVPQSHVRVVTADVGGSFGMRTGVYPELVLVLWAAKRLNESGPVQRGPAPGWAAPSPPTASSRSSGPAACRRCTT